MTAMSPPESLTAYVCEKGCGYASAPKAEDEIHHHNTCGGSLVPVEYVPRARPVQDDDDAIAALDAILAWAREKPQAIAEGGDTGTSYQRGRVIITETHDGTVGVSTYETQLDATRKLVEMERSYREYLRRIGKRPRDAGDPRRVEKALGIPESFGGLLGAWVDDDHALIARVGYGRIQEAMMLTPLNALQLRRNMDELISRGKADGRITDEHERQSAELPPMPPGEYHPDYAPRD